MNIILVISSLSSGGAERVMSIMANYWAAKGWNTTVITLAGKDSDFFQLDGSVKRIALDYEFPSNNLFKAIYFNFKKIYLLRRAIKFSSPDVVISFMDKINVITLIAMIGHKTPIIISERTVPDMYSIGRIWEVLRNYFYSFADHLTVQSCAVQHWADQKWKNLKNSIIANPVVIPINKPSDKLLDSKYRWCIAIGRLSHEKGFDVLINAFSQVKTRDLKNEWKLVILGDGDNRQDLIRQVELLGLKDYVFMPGRVNNPYDYLYQADLFILSSRFEGFPNVLLEAMTSGLPVISTNCPSGPAEIIQNNFNGILVESENCNALAAAIQDFMENEKKRKDLAKEALKSASRFRPDKIMSQWESLIYEVINVRT